MSLAGAIWFARTLQRRVVVDWRGSAFLKDQSLNYFTEFFETVPEIQGVPVSYAPSGPPDEGELDPARSRVLGLTAAREVLRTGASHPELILRDYHGLERLDPTGDPADRFFTEQAFYRYIRPRDFVRREIDAWAQRHLTDAFVVGVNVSTGNGEFAKGQLYYGRVDLSIFRNRMAFLRRIERARERAIRRLPAYLRSRTKVFFATDSYAMRDLLLEIPGAVTRRTMFPPAGVGRVFCAYDEPGHSDRAAIVDTIADMFLLARCNALISNFSVFNHYARVMTNGFGGNFHNMESLYARYWVRAAVSRARWLVGR